MSTVVPDVVALSSHYPVTISDMLTGLIKLINLKRIRLLNYLAYVLVVETVSCHFHSEHSLPSLAYRHSMSNLQA